MGTLPGGMGKKSTGKGFAMKFKLLQTSLYVGLEVERVGRQAGERIASARGRLYSRTYDVS